MRGADLCAAISQAPPRMRPEDPDAEAFLQYFYDECITLLLAPIFNLPELSPLGPFPSLLPSNPTNPLFPRPASRPPPRNRRPLRPPLRPPLLLHLAPHLSVQVLCPLHRHRRRRRPPLRHEEQAPPPRRHKVPSRVHWERGRVLQQVLDEERPVRGSGAAGGEGEGEGQFGHVGVFGVCRVCQDGEFFFSVLFLSLFVRIVGFSLEVNGSGKSGKQMTGGASGFADAYRSRVQSPSKPVVDHLMEHHGQEIRQLALTLKTFEGLIVRWEQLNEPPPKLATAAESTATSKCVPPFYLPRPLHWT